MRIAYVSFWFYDYTIRMANEISKTNDVIIFLPDNIPKIYLDDLSRNIKLELFKYSSLYSLLSFCTIISIVKRVRGFNPSTVHFQMLNPLILPIILLLKNYTIVVTYHDAIPHLGEGTIFSKIVFKLVAFLSDSIIVHGQHIKNIFIEYYKVNDDKVDAIPLGRHEIDIFKKFEDPQVREEKGLVLFFGRIKKYKGVEYLIDAEPYIQKQIPNVRILIAGKGDFKTSTKNPNIQFENRYIGYEEGAHLFQKCSVVVLPYVEASQSGVIPAAFGFRKPIISTDVGSLKEIIEHEKTGLIVPAKDAHKLADAIIRLLEDEKLRNEIGAAGYQKLNNELSWEFIKKEIFLIYQRAALRKNQKLSI